jgi:hypothetical protein
VTLARANVLIQDLCRDPDNMARFRNDPEACFDNYGLDDREKAALRTGDPMVVVRDAGVHPILAIHYLFAVNPDAMAQMSVRHYPQLLED